MKKKVKRQGRKTLLKAPLLQKKKSLPLFLNI